MYKQTKRVTDTSTWAASSDLASLKLPREGLITEIKLRANITMSAALTAVQPDGLTRAIQNLKIEGDGGRAFLGMSGEQMGRLLYFWTVLDHGAQLINLPTGTDAHITFVFHPGSNPKDPFDTTAVIPARALSELLAKITTTANSVVDDTTTISSGVYYFEVNQVMEVPVGAGMMTPIGSSLTYAHTATFSDFSAEIDVPTGNYLRRIFLLDQDETATRPVRKDDQVTGVKLSVPGIGRTIIESNWQDLKAETAKQARLNGYNFQVADTTTGHLNVPDGMVCIDLRKYFDPVYGLDLRSTQTGKVKLGLTIGSYAAGDDTLIYWDQLQAVQSGWVGK